MGWDAHAIGVKIDYSKSLPQIIDPVQNRVFITVFNSVKKACGTVDGLLDQGGLDCTICGEMLERATGQDCDSEQVWRKEKVRRLAEKADFSFSVKEDERWAKESARAFLYACAALNCSIRFW